MLMFAPGLNERSFWQTQGMARAIGVDLTEALTNGTLDRSRYVGMVAGCGNCDHNANCSDWLAEAPAADAAPEFCRLKNILETLKVRQK